MWLSAPKIQRWLEQKASENPRQFVSTKGENPIENMLAEDHPRTEILDVLPTAVGYAGYKRGGTVKKLPVTKPVARIIDAFDSLGAQRISAGRALEIAQDA